ncbi:MAG: hypothetical protein COA44_14280 [Arcobacter sp.]|nr:MAG: hypothetical protein COA44_14280 [Arcobacter sp.]
MILEGIKALTIYEVEKVQVLFIKELSTSQDLVLDMQAIEKIDMVGIQLLLSLVKSAETNEKNVSFSNITDSVLQQIKICHCQHALGITNE